MAKRKRKDVVFDTGRVLVGSCLEKLKDLGDESIDSIVTDPPYELGFMGKSWDASGVAYSVELWREALRVLKPGGHLLAFGGTRTYHRMAVAIEDAGFEIRDSIHWVYGSGFPKSLNVSKAIDKAAGAEREVLRTVIRTASAGNSVTVHQEGGDKSGVSEITAPSTDAAKQWDGWGTALKPAHEPIVLARKPLAGTVAANVLEHGTGALNIDGCRVGEFVNTTPSGIDRYNQNYVNDGSERSTIEGTTSGATGRWPANVIFDEAAGAELDEQSGVSKSRVGKPRGTEKKGLFANSEFNKVGTEHDDEGGASRFFYCPKPGKKERNAGLDKLKAKTAGEATDRKEDSDGLNSPRAGAGRTGGSKNFHPTVKPVELMRYLCRLVTPPNGTVLDPFLGSGTTAVAAVLEGFEWVGCEMTPEYLPIIKGRVEWAQNEQPKLF
jgi:site-specific DNA-methyltransferase (adenine-specific)